VDGLGIWGPISAKSAETIHQDAAISTGKRALLLTFFEECHERSLRCRLRRVKWLDATGKSCASASTTAVRITACPVAVGVTSAVPQPKGVAGL